LFQPGNYPALGARAAMRLKTKVWTAAFAAAMVSIVLALGGVGIVVSRTKVSPEAIELSVIHADDTVERAWSNIQQARLRLRVIRVVAAKSALRPIFPR
jgi:hypothetical protein